MPQAMDSADFWHTQNEVFASKTTKKHCNVAQRSITRHGYSGVRNYMRNPSKSTACEYGTGSGAYNPPHHREDCFFIILGLENLHIKLT
jgi:hypothetical protein